MKAVVAVLISPPTKAKIPRNNTNDIEFIRNNMPTDSARTAFHMGLVEATQIKNEHAIEMAFHHQQRDAAATAARIKKLEKQIISLKRAVIETEAEFATFTGDKATELERLGYSIEVYLEETKAMLRNSERELSQLLGNPPSAEELEEEALKKLFVSLSFKAGMYAYVREDILESSPYHVNLKEYWSRHIENCREAIVSKEPLGDYEEA